MISLKIEDVLALAEEEGMIIVDGFDDAIIGLSSRCGGNTIIAYDIDRMVLIMSERESISFEESYEYIEYNIIGQYCGEMSPCFIRKTDEI